MCVWRSAGSESCMSSRCVTEHMMMNSLPKWLTLSCHCHKSHTHCPFQKQTQTHKTGKKWKRTHPRYWLHIKLNQCESSTKLRFGQGRAELRKCHRSTTCQTSRIFTCQADAERYWPWPPSGTTYLRFWPVYSLTDVFRTIKRYRCVYIPRQLK